MSTVARLRLKTSSTRELNSHCEEEVNRRRSEIFTDFARVFVILSFIKVFLSTVRASQDSIVTRDFKCSLNNNAYTFSSISDRASNKSALWRLVDCVFIFSNHWSEIVSSTHLVKLQLSSTSIFKLMSNWKMFYRSRVKRLKTINEDLSASNIELQNSSLFNWSSCDSLILNSNSKIMTHSVNESIVVRLSNFDSKRKRKRRSSWKMFKV